MGLPEMIARGLLERGESLGINKTVMNAVSELKVSLILFPVIAKCSFGLFSAIYLTWPHLLLDYRVPQARLMQPTP